MVTQTILCSLTTGKPDEPIFCRYGEKGRQIKFGLINPIMDFTGYNATFYLFKPDGNFVVETLTIDNSGEFATLTLDENMTSASGRGVWDIKLSQSNVVVYTFNGEILIDKPTVTDEVIESVSVANGYVFPDDFQEKLTAGAGITIDENNVISSEGESYTGGTYINISAENVIDLDQSVINEINGKQDELTAGAGISINNNVISVSGLYSMALINTPPTSHSGINSHSFIDINPDIKLNGKQVKGFIPKYMGNPYFVCTNVYAGGTDNDHLIFTTGNFGNSYQNFVGNIEGVLLYEEGASA